MARHRHVVAKSYIFESSRILARHRHVISTSSLPGPFESRFFFVSPFRVKSLSRIQKRQRITSVPSRRLSFVGGFLVVTFFSVGVQQFFFLGVPPVVPLLILHYLPKAIRPTSPCQNFASLYSHLTTSLLGQAADQHNLAHVQIKSIPPTAVS